MNVPKLRFKEFSGEWEEKLIGDCFVKINDRNKTKSINNIISNTAKYGLVKQEQYFDKDIAIQENTENYYVIDKGDFVYNPRKSVEAPYGPIRLYQLEETGIVSPLYLCFRSKNKLFDYFYNYFFQSSKWYRYIYRNGDSGARADRVNIKDEVFFSLNTFLPILDEQEKIVDFLDIVCRKINNQQAIVESLEKQKKGLMQKIFSQELRFKDDDGKEFPVWEEKKLREVFNITAGGDIDKAHVSKTKNGTFVYPVYANALTNSGVYGYSDVYKIEDDAITVTGRGDIGVAKARTGKFYPIVRLLVLVPKEKMDIIFFENLINYTKKYDESTGVSQLTVPQLAKIKVKIPSFEEQFKIGALFGSLDAKIEKEKVVLDHWQQIKKGLLQQMFV